MGYLLAMPPWTGRAKTRSGARFYRGEPSRGPARSHWRGNDRLTPKEALHVWQQTHGRLGREDRAAFLKSEDLETLLRSFHRDVAVRALREKRTLFKALLWARWNFSYDYRPGR